MIENGKYIPTEFIGDITEIVAHFTTPSGRENTKTFTNTKDYLKWEKVVEEKGYDISCLDTQGGEIV